ncbi:MAG: ATP--guanido phosphotransferase [Tissierellia bacterium]|nr:ATP--guanido phosphotransferase [Tissierellia bacterium]
MSIVIERSLSLYRNIKGFSFMPTLEKDQGFQIINQVESILIEEGYRNEDISSKSSLKKLELLEQGEITSDFLKSSITRLYKKENKPNILLNTGNHLTFHKKGRDLDFQSSYDEINEIEEKLDQKLNFIFDPTLGYLTTKPIHCGTGFFPSVKLHLPALNYFGIEGISRSLFRLGYSFTPYSVRGNKAIGSLYRLSFESTLGEREEKYINKIETITGEITAIEEESRKKLYLDNIITLEDMVNRSLGTLRNARILPEDEMMEAMSYIDLGLELSILKPKKKIDFYQEMMKLKNGHLQVERGSILDLKSRDILRANRSRALMKEVF